MKLISQIIIKLSLLLGVVLTMSCGNKESTVVQKKSRSGLDKYNDGYDLGKGDHGMNVSKSSKKSSYNNLKTSHSGGAVSKVDYGKDSYRTKRWGGGATYFKKSYSGKQDASNVKGSPYYVSQNNNFNNTFSTSGSNYQGQSYGTSGSALEGTVSHVRAGSSGYINSKSNVSQPTVISKEDYKEMAVSETNSMLGR